MRPDSIRADHARALAAAILDIVAPCLREEERNDALEAFYEAAMAALRSYDETIDRLRSRVRPSDN